MRANAYKLGAAVLVTVFVAAIFFVGVKALIGVWYSTTFTKVSTGQGTSCGIASGRVYCWGANGNGQLGIGSTTQSNYAVPVSVSGVLAGKTVTDVSVSQGANQHVCVVASGAAYCWGYNVNGELGTGTVLSSNVPVAVSTVGALAGKTVTAIAAGIDHTCAVASSAVYCWGANGNGQLGRGNTLPSTLPVAVVTTGVLSGKTITNVTAGDRHSCVIGSNQPYCWGLNASGQLGDNSTTQRTSPVAVVTTGVLSGKTSTVVSAQHQHTCVVASAAAYCWGENGAYQVGDNSKTNRRVPVAVSFSGGAVADISAGTTRSCLSTTTNVGYCWGAKYNGDGSNNSARTPAAITLTTAAIKVAAGYDQSCVTSTQRIYCWGYNSTGQVGDNTTSDTNTPVQVYTNLPTDHAGYRIGVNTPSANPTQAWAATNSPFQLLGPNKQFRVRMGIKSVTTNGSNSLIQPGNASYILQYAQKTGGSCVTQTGYAEVTGATPITWYAYGGPQSVGNDVPITSSPADPVLADPIVYQTYRSAAGSFTPPNAVPVGSVGLWDFSLQSNSAPTNTTYCIRIANSDGTTPGGAGSIAEITTYVPQLAVGVVDANGSTVASPAFSMSLINVFYACQQSTGTFGVASQKLRVHNSVSTTGWSVSLAATGGNTALWNSTGNLHHFDYNDPSACVSSGTDGDSYAGQLTINPSTATLSADPECATTGISLGTSAAFTSGSISAITLLNASATTQVYCYWDMIGVSASQQVPPSQNDGVYSIDMTATVVAL